MSGGWVYTDEQALSDGQDFLLIWEEFVSLNDPAGLVLGQDYFVHMRNLWEVFKRADKRRDYYERYHGITKVNEYKKAGALAYWLCKLKPFMVVKESSGIYNAPNERFAMHVILLTIKGVFEAKKPGQPFSYPGDDFMKEALYDLKYVNMNDETLVLFIETLAAKYRVGMNRGGASRDILNI